MTVVAMERRILQLGDEIQCQKCRGWHVTFAKARDDGRDSPYEQRMLWIRCRGDFYFAGAIGTPSLHPTRPGHAAARGNGETDASTRR